MSRCSLAVLALLGAFVPFVSPGAAQAHLSIIRQGPESYGIAENGDRFGETVVAGDFDGDGYDDLATGSPREGGGTDGVVTVNYGSAHGLTHLSAFHYGPWNFGPFPLPMRFGASLAAADLNDDGFDDLIVGAPWTSRAGVSRCGRIFIYAGSPDGPVPWVTYAQEDLGGFSEFQDHFGSSLTTGNFNNDAYEDIAIGSPAFDGREGKVFVLYGTATGPFGATDILSAESLGATLEVGDHFGWALAAGNTIGDTKDDLVIGAPYREAFGRQSAGVCFVVPGGTNGLAATGNVRFTAQVADDAAAGAAFGRSLAILEVGTFDRIVVGEPWRSIGSNARAGRVVVVNTNVDGPIYGSSIVLTQGMFGTQPADYDEFGTSLATGYFQDDGFPDLAVGTPRKESLSGVVHMIYGGGGDIGSSGHYVYRQDSIGETIEAGDAFGTSVAFGAFDATDQGTLVVGAPGEDSNRGMVHVIAPWRQFPFQAHKTAIVTDCQGDIVFSQKPFDQVYIASTTKIMTVLLACERTQLPPGNPRHMELTDLYTVPDWVAEEIPGSTADLLEGEVVSLLDLMHLALGISGNDAAHAIADLLWGSGGPNESLPLFVQEMNDRAQEIGMTDTAFNNPNGFEQEAVGYDLGEHFSTAYDMEMLSRAAMANPLFREISGTTDWTAMRRQGDGTIVNHTFASFQTWILENEWGLNGSGLKGGNTNAAQTTWCASAEGSGTGRAIATTFGSPDGSGWGADLLRLLTLGVGDCATWQLWEDWEFEYLHTIEGIRAVADNRDFYSLLPSIPMDMQIDLFHATAEALPTNAIVRLRRESQIVLDPQETIPYHLAEFEGLDAIRITNGSSWPASLYIVVPGSNDFNHYIPAGGTIEIHVFGYTGPDFGWSIMNNDSTGDPLELSVQEIYVYDLLVGDEPTPDPIFSVTIERNEGNSHDLVTLEFEWREDGGEYVLVAHEAGTVVGLDGEESVDWSSASPVLELSPPAPNPSAGETAIRFALRRAAEVAISIHDASGRRIRRYPPSQRTPGAWSLTWDGRTGSGESAAPGVYFYRIEVDGVDLAGGKLSRIR